MRSEAPAAHQVGGALKTDTRRIGTATRRPTLAIGHGNGLMGSLAVEHERQRVVEELLEAIELGPNAYDVVTAPHVSSAAIAAGMARGRGGAPPCRRGEFMGVRGWGWGHAREQARHAIRTRQGEDPAVARVVDEVASDIVKGLPALMLLPQSRVVDGLVRELETAAAQDDLPDEQQRLKDWLSQLQKDLLRIDLSHEAGWHRAQGLIEFYAVDSGGADEEDAGKGHKLPS